jgi:hypothetical protein
MYTAVKRVKCSKAVKHVTALSDVRQNSMEYRLLINTSKTSCTERMYVALFFSLSPAATRSTATKKQGFFLLMKKTLLLVAVLLEAG